MRLKSISFENYKAFKDKQTLEIKPITILIGKNSSGKSSIAKLFTMLENSLSGKIEEPILLKNNNVEIGSEFVDLSFNRQPSVPILFSLTFENEISLDVSIVQEFDKYELLILDWNLKTKDAIFNIKYYPEKGYRDLSEKEYYFNGFVPFEVQTKNRIELNINFDVDYIGPFRVLPERLFYLTGQINFSKTGVKGENAYSMLGVSKLTKGNLHQDVGYWFKEHFEGWELIIEDRNKPFIQILLSKGESNINIVDVGQGMNQALPLIVRAHIKVPDSIIILEQPELHLHPAAHADLAELFVKSAIEKNQIFIVETHSENILLRIRKLIIENNFGFTHEDVVIYFVDEGETIGQALEKVTIDREGVLTNWPEGVFNENVNEIIEIRKAIKRIQKSHDNKD